MGIEEARSRIYRIREDEKPEIPRFSTQFIDKDVDPLENFFLYSNGNWIRDHPIPPEKPYWGASVELSERNRYILGKILETSALGERNEDPVREMVGKFYLSAMDTETIERLRFTPVEKMMSLIDGMGTKQEMILKSADLHESGVPVLFSFESSPDDKNSSMYAYRMSQGGISLPNRDYYTQESFDSIRKEFKNHITRMFVLFGLNEEDARNHAETVFNIELQLARSSRSPEELREPEKNYNRVEFGKIENLAPGIDFGQYFSLIGLPAVEYLVVGQPEFYANLGSMVEQVPLEDWKIYLKWKVLHFAASFLHAEVEKENFEFYYRKLFGQPEQEKRWKLAVSIIDMSIGEALGKLYVEQEYGEEARNKMATMVEDLREVFVQRLKNLTWMTDSTKKKALEKFSRFRAKIGYPSKFIDYSTIEITPDDYLGNVMRSNAFEFRRQISRVNTPVDRELWLMTPPTVNAYFSPTENEIVFPAGILQPPFFDPDLDEAVNYGSIGGTIAHEITHGFDDEGRKYDSEGNLKEWWSEEDAREFLSRSGKVAELYNTLMALPGLYVNGKLTLGENIADLGGVSIAFEALQRRLERNPELRKTVEGFTPEQRFFLGWGQSWRSSIRDEALKWQISNDPHSPDNFRGDLPARVHPQFEEHFRSLSKKGTTNLVSIEIW